ncbi:isoprenylcysteine carboxylmethyltransferase family protein [Gluconobacter frateurii]|uniref:methyltransferase family protein n=1 Tax=Gluconobacter frateurii TaxID=38308 RepID=UPI001F0660DC|nr:isoprenylcysteine carboxylmethyltransferase family protein [Gluconobacter frateurii]UMM09463.1 isoprenylcysteine carboxylmethyltransferase family protein [Gluconobacter frateurii]
MSIFLILVLSALNFLSFSWGVRGHFQMGNGMPFPMKVLSACSLVFYGIFLISMKSAHLDTWVLAGTTFLFVSALALFWWTIATTRRNRPDVAHHEAAPHQLYCNGPYRIVRHPFYLAYLLFWIGTAVSAGAWQWLGAILFTVWYGLLAYQEERRFIQSDLGDIYADYQRKSWMLFPVPWLK